MTLDDYRRFYAEEIEQIASLTSPALVEAFARVPREKFLGQPPWHISAAASAGLMEVAYRATSEPRHLYHNVLVSVDRAKDINNGQPSAVASWIAALDLKTGDRAYHMGCGVGYYAAILAEIVGSSGSVVAIDAQPDLAARAQASLSGYPNVTVHAADGATFDPDVCDAMLITAGVTHPHALWLERLREGGRLVLPLTIAVSPTVGQGVMLRFIRRRNGFAANLVTFVAIFNGVNLRDPELEAPLREGIPKAMGSGGMAKMRSLRRDAHEREASCVVHAPGLCLSGRAICEPEFYMSTLQNRQFKLASRPAGMVKRSDFEFVTAPAGEPGPGEALVKVLYLSLDPAMRGWMNAGRSYIAPVGIGEVMRAGGVGRVVASKDPSLAVDDTVAGMTGVQDYAIAKAANFTKVDPRLAPLPRYLGALGMPGLTAYFGLLDIGQPKEGETVVVSAAAGAVGAVVGQIAKIKGCRAIGIAGGPDKCKYVVEELGFDAAIDYKNEDVRAGLAQHCPKGIDIYFDNVGGEILDIVLSMLARRARVIICGAVSQYNNLESIQGPRNYMSLLVNHGRMEGFVVFEYAARYPEGVQALAGWMMGGKLKAREDIVEGLETFPETLQMLFRGENFGKLVIKV
jgi:NADPH-dependent curcumin reductase CurA/protein-L-isoaspartate O-methyltransferase